MLALGLVEQGVDDAEAVAQLRAEHGDREALRDAAALITRQIIKGYPNTRIHRLLRAAADDPLPALTVEQAAVENRQRKLWEQPYSVSFRELAEQVPALEELERRARRDPRDRQVRTLLGINKAVQRLIGPDAGRDDPVLSSLAAARAVQFHLRETAGIDPRTWRDDAG